MPTLTTLLLPLALLANAPGTPPPKPSGAPLDSMPRVTSREFELYGPTEEEVRKANDELRVAIAQFVMYMGQQPRRMAFVLFRSAEEAKRLDSKPFARRNLPIVPWILPAGPAAQPGGGSEVYPLAHEAAHRFLADYVEHTLALEAAGSGGAGTASVGAVASLPAGAHASAPALPDWLEEGVAALCERPALQRSRMDFLRAHLDARIPFAELLTMARPVPRGASGGKDGKPATGVDRATLFCDEAYSLARFIGHREEDRFVGTVIEGVLRGRTASDVLNTSQNLMSKPEALEKQWLEWMQGAERTP